jgi:prepilin-type N-terminal cleavage/methylation domain-containing protein
MPTPASRARRAFTLIELVIVIAILAIVAGSAVPVASKFFHSRARSATRTELAALSEAVSEYFRDTGALPASVGSLVVDPSLPGWAGPYLAVETADAWTGASDLQLDAWARAYRFTASGSSALELASAAEDGTFGSEDDLVSRVDVTPVRREKTLRQLETLNTAITRYNATYLPGSPLSTTYATLLTRLVTTGFLPDAAAYGSDGWGSPFVPDPAGKTPVVAVTSQHLDAAASGGGSTGTGKGKGKKGSGGKKGGSDKGGGKKG